MILNHYFDKKSTPKDLKPRILTLVKKYPLNEDYKWIPKSNLQEKGFVEKCRLQEGKESMLDVLRCKANTQASSIRSDNHYLYENLENGKETIEN